MFQASCVQRAGICITEMGRKSGVGRVYFGAHCPKKNCLNLKRGTFSILRMAPGETLKTVDFLYITRTGRFILCTLLTAQRKPQ